MSHGGDRGSHTRPTTVTVMARRSTTDHLSDLLRRAARGGLRAWRRATPGPQDSTTLRPAPTPPARGGAYPGDFTGIPAMAYAPAPDGRPDPGEIVWTWVPYEEDAGRGKDRPVLLVGRDGDWLLGLQLTSKDHDRDAAQERRAGRVWVDIGTGAWDSRGRPSEVRVNRVIRVDPAAVRREGAVLARARFDEVAAAVRAHRRS